MEYQDRSRDKEKEKDKVEIKIEKIIEGEVVIKKKTFGARVKKIILEMDFGGMTHHVIHNILIPGTKNIVFDAGSEALKRAMFGEYSRRPRPGGGSHVSYNRPIERGDRYHPVGRNAPPVSSLPRSSRYDRDDIVLPTRDDAERVLERMVEVIGQVDEVTLADLNELVGRRSTHVDNKFGWTDLRGVEVRQIREGYLIDFPPVETL